MLNSSLPRLQGHRGTARSNSRTSSSSIGAQRRVAPVWMATSAAWLLLLGLSSSIGATEAQSSLECQSSNVYGYIRYSAYSDDFFSAVAPGHSFYEVRPCFIQPAEQPNHPPTRKHRTHARTRKPYKATAASHHSVSCEALIHFWLSLSTPSLAPPSSPLLLSCARASSLLRALMMIAARCRWRGLDGNNNYTRFAGRQRK